MNIIQETRDPFSLSACPFEEDANVNGFVHGRHHILFTISFAE